MAVVTDATYSLTSRIIRVTVEVGGILKTYEGSAKGFDIAVSGNKTIGFLQNNCRIRISNIERETRNYLITETSPFNRSRKRKKIKVEAGDAINGVSQVYVGDIWSVTPTQPPDIGLVFDCKTGFFGGGTLVSYGGTKAATSFKTVSQQAAEKNGLSLEFDGEEKSFNNFSFAGTAWNFIDTLTRIGGHDVFVDDETLVVKQEKNPRKGNVRLLNENSGMLGVPEVTERGLRIRYLFDPISKIGGQIKIESKLNPGANGTYPVYLLRFDLATKTPQFYYTAEVLRFGGLFY